jgi:hypothetical protein
MSNIREQVRNNSVALISLFIVQKNSRNDSVPRATTIRRGCSRRIAD